MLDISIATSFEFLFCSPRGTFPHVTTLKKQVNVFYNNNRLDFHRDGFFYAGHM